MMTSVKTIAKTTAARGTTSIRRRRPTGPLLGCVLGLTVLMSACEFGPGLETRTFRVEHLGAGEAVALLDPYVFGDREGNPGAISVLDGAVTVRETRDNLARIERVLAEFDTPRPPVQLHFQLIEADGFTGSDARIADVEAELRNLFDFRGYRLGGEATVLASTRSDFFQGLRASDRNYELSGGVEQAGGSAIRLSDLRLYSQDGWALETSVTVRTGQTIIVGSQPLEGSSATLFLTVRAEAVGGAS